MFDQSKVIKGDMANRKGERMEPQEKETGRRQERKCARGRGWADRQV